MQLIVVRHGKAETQSDSGRDEERRLKSRGERQAQFLGDYFSDAACRPALIMTSRLERAFTTARLIQQAVGSPLQTAPELESGRPVSDALDLIRAQTAEPLMIVGHNPQLSELIWALTRGLPAEDSGLRTGEAVVLTVDPADPVGTAHPTDRVRIDQED